MPVESAKMFLVGNGERLVMRICCYHQCEFQLQIENVLVLW